MENANLNIAVIDDDPSMTSAVQRLLNAAGFKVMPYNSAEAFLAANVKPDCIICAVYLSGLSGFALRRVLMLDKTPPPPMVFITAFDETGARAEAEKLGASGYLTKPFTSADLISAINRGTQPASFAATNDDRPRRS
jgi:FixJ family two-component response regulator